MKIKSLIQNKKGISMTGWTEGILLVILMTLILALVVGNFNVMYGKDNQIGLGTNATLLALENYQGTLESEIQGGEADFDSSSGLTLTSSWGIIKTGSNIVWGFLTGGWIETAATQYMRLPSEVALIFRILYFLSVGFIILKLLFKVKP